MFAKRLKDVDTLFQSAISRYLVSNKVVLIECDTEDKRVSIRYIAVLGFQQDDNAFDIAMKIMFQSAISRYLVSNFFEEFELGDWREVFQSAISRYLVSNRLSLTWTMSKLGFNPLYRGTWFPTPYEVD